MSKSKINVNPIIDIFIKIVCFVAAILALFQYWQNMKLKEDKYNIVAIQSELIAEKNITIQSLRDENYLLRNQLRPFKKSETPEILNNMHGKVQSSTNMSLPDVKIDIDGGSQKYSNSTGEFLISCNIGQTIRFMKKGYRSRQFIINKDNLQIYNNITLEEARQ